MLSPFDKSAYRRILNGLEVAEAGACDVFAHKLSRIDSEYFQKKYLANARVMASPTVLSDVLSPQRRRGVRGLKLSKKFNYLEISRISTTELGYETVSVAPSNIPDRADLILRPGDVAVSTVRPNRNAVALVQNATRLVGSSGLAVLRPAKVSPEYLFSFAKTRHFAAALTRETTATMYPAVSVNDVLGVPFFAPSRSFDDSVRNTVKQSAAAMLSAKRAYDEASRALLDNLGLREWSPQQGGVCIKSFRESLGGAGRLDAEYYRPKFASIVAVIKRQQHAQLNDVARIAKSIEPGSDAYCDEGIPFVRVSDLSKFGIAPAKKHLSRCAAFPDELHPRKDTILFTKDGTIGIAYKAEDNLPLITSGAILHLTVRNPRAVLPDYLALVLNSLPVKIQAERDTIGSIIQHWRPGDIKKTLVPILPVGTQGVIADKVKASFLLLSRSKEFLDTARRAVEIAIEKGEDAAMKFLHKHSRD